MCSQFVRAGQVDGRWGEPFQRVLGRTACCRDFLQVSVGLQLPRLRIALKLAFTVGLQHDFVETIVPPPQTLFIGSKGGKPHFLQMWP